MTIVETTPREYDLLFGNDNICYNTAAFNVMNNSKCDEVLFLLFKDSKIRLGLVTGRKGKCLMSPFSAPFGGFSVINDRLSVQHVENAVDVLKAYCKSNGYEYLRLTLPPLFYNESFLTKVQHVLFQKGFKIEALDLNYLFHLKQILNNYSTEVLTCTARNKLKIGLSKGMSFRIGEGLPDLMAAYEIIRQNRAFKGFELSMTADGMTEAAKLLKIDSFIITFEDKAIASAIIYHVTNKMLQLIYWGDLPEYSSNKTMNFLSYKVFEYYYLKGFGLIDVGTAMLDHKPNYGLCEFKESIGCVLQPKCTFSIDFSDGESLIHLS